MDLQQCIATHTAAVSRSDLPSTVYQAGGVLTAERWRDHAVKNAGKRDSRHCAQMAKLSRVYGSAFEIIEVRNG